MIGLLQQVLVMILFFKFNFTRRMACHWRCVVVNTRFDLTIQSDSMCGQGTMGFSGYLAKPGWKKCVSIADNRNLELLFGIDGPVTISYGATHYNLNCAGYVWGTKPWCQVEPIDTTNNVDGKKLI